MKRPDHSLAISAAITLACCIAFATSHPPAWASWALAILLMTSRGEHRLTRAAIREASKAAPDEVAVHG